MFANEAIFVPLDDYEDEEVDSDLIDDHEFYDVSEAADILSEELDMDAVECKEIARSNAFEKIKRLI
jgi:hypothetical protein